MTARDPAAALLAPREVPFLFPELPGIGGIVRAAEEDFAVEELPLYEPSGSGDHLFVRIEKRGRTTPEVARELAAALAVPERDVGAAGLKDKRAVAVQRLSVPLPSKASAAAVERFIARAAAAHGPGWRALEAVPHGNKLRPGHLRGNRFRIVVRGCVPGALERAERVAQALRTAGAANLYGPQRFGRSADNADLGAAILRGEAAAFAARDRFLRRLALSALQAELFNRCLASRIADGLFAAAIDGDVLRKRGTGGLFVCEDPAEDTPRVARCEVDPAGPLPGHSLFAARGEASAREARVVVEAGLDPASFQAGGREMQGTRRPYRIPVEDLSVAPEGSDTLVLSFSLPKGGYAAAVLREVMKAPAEPRV